MKKEKENKPTLQDEITALRQHNANQAKTIEALKESGKEMGKEILTLKRSIASYKSANTVLRAKIETCKGEAQSEVERLHIEIDDLKATLCAKDKAIQGLESQVNTLKETIAVRNDKVKRLSDELTEADAIIEHFKSLPWYKRIFFK